MQQIIFIHDVAEQWRATGEPLRVYARSDAQTRRVPDERYDKGARRPTGATI
jgi:hypothetical protein